MLDFLKAQETIPTFLSCRSNCGLITESTKEVISSVHWGPLIFSLSLFTDLEAFYRVEWKLLGSKPHTNRTGI